MSEIHSLKFWSQRVNFNLKLYTGAFPKEWTQQQSYNNQASLPDDSLVVPCIGNKVSYLGPHTHGAGKLTAKM